MVTEKKAEASRRNISKANSSGKAIHRGEDNGRWKGGSRKRGLHPCPVCRKDRYCEFRDAWRKCRECSYKNLNPRGPYKVNRTRSSYYWEARRIIVRSGTQLTSDNHVHHIDGNWKNNDIKNLLVTTKWEHRRLYHS